MVWSSICSWQLATSRPFYSLSHFRFGLFLPRISGYNMTYTLPALCTETNFRPESKTSWERMREMERRSNSMHSLYLIFHCSRSIPLSLFSFVPVCMFLYYFISAFCFCFVLFCYYFYLFFIFSPEFTVLKDKQELVLKLQKIRVWCSR